MITTCSDGKRCPRHRHTCSTPSPGDPCRALTEMEIGEIGMRSLGGYDSPAAGALAVQLLAREQELVAQREKVEMLAAHVEAMATRGRELIQAAEMDACAAEQERDALRAEVARLSVRVTELQNRLGCEVESHAAARRALESAHDEVRALRAALT